MLDELRLRPRLPSLTRPILPIRIVSTALLLLLLAVPDPRPPAEVVACDPQDGPALNARFKPIGGVSLGTGAFQMEAIDIGQGAGLAGTFRRAYLSLDTRTTLLGPGWMNNFQARLRSDGSRDVLFTLPSGAVERFKNAWDSDRSFGTSRGYRVLTRAPDGRWVIADDGATWTFDPDGQLLRVENEGRDWVEVRYEGGKLASTVGRDGPGLRFEVGPNARLMRVTDAVHPSNTVDFEYDAAGRLIRSAPSNGEVRQFMYDGESQRIATISDGNGHILLSLDYDEFGWVVRDRDGLGLIDGEGVLFAYERRPDKSVRATLTYPPSLTEPEWHPIKIAELDSEARLVELQVQPTSSRRYVGRYKYDPDNRRIALEGQCPIPGIHNPATDPLIAVGGLTGIASLAQAGAPSYGP